MFCKVNKFCKILQIFVIIFTFFESISPLQRPLHNKPKLIKVYFGVFGGFFVSLRMVCLFTDSPILNLIFEPDFCERYCLPQEGRCVGRYGVDRAPGPGYYRESARALSRNRARRRAQCRGFGRGRREAQAPRSHHCRRGPAACAAGFAVAIGH